ncbi:MAG: protein jag [Bryobacteraceae bacterium]
MSERKYSAERIGPRIEAFLKAVFKHAGFRLRFEVTDAHSPHPEIEDPEVMVKFSGPDVDLLLANRAELLLALEHVTMEVLGMPPEHHALLCFDANDYRFLRMEELRMSAAAAAEKVRRTGASFTFNPMTSRERRILHLALRDESGVRSESTGFGSHRQVVVYSTDATSASEPANVGPAGPQYSRRPRRR